MNEGLREVIASLKRSAVVQYIVVEPIPGMPLVKFLFSTTRQREVIDVTYAIATRLGMRQFIRDGWLVVKSGAIGTPESVIASLSLSLLRDPDRIRAVPVPAAWYPPERQ